MLEKQLEKKICEYAKNKGFLAYKFVSPNNRGVPDRLFISKFGNIFFIEFKSKLGKIAPLQKLKIDKLISHNVKVYFVNSEEKGKEIIDTHVDF